MDEVLKSVYERLNILEKRVEHIGRVGGYGNFSSNIPDLDPDSESESKPESTPLNPNLNLNR